HGPEVVVLDSGGDLVHFAEPQPVLDGGPDDVGEEVGYFAENARNGPGIRVLTGAGPLDVVDGAVPGDVLDDGGRLLLHRWRPVHPAGLPVGLDVLVGGVRQADRDTAHADHALRPELHVLLGQRVVGGRELVGAPAGARGLAVLVEYLDECLGSLVVVELSVTHHERRVVHVLRLDVEAAAGLGRPGPGGGSLLGALLVGGQSPAHQAEPHPRSTAACAAA